MCPSNNSAPVFLQSFTIPPVQRTNGDDKPFTMPPNMAALPSRCLGNSGVISLSSQGATRQSTADTLAARLVQGVPGIQASLDGPAGAFGGFCSYFGLQDGVVLTTGLISGINTQFDTYTQGYDHNPVGVKSDKASLTLKFRAIASSTLSFRFVFASQEMPRYFGSKYNDDFKIMIDGTNIALLPNGQEVNINNLGSNKASGWSDQFVLNQPPVPGSPVGMTGYTKVQTVSRQVAPGNHTLEFHVADVQDGRMDTVVFIEGGSVKLTRRSSGRPVDAHARTQPADPVDAVMDSETTRMPAWPLLVASTALLAVVVLASLLTYRRFRIQLNEVLRERDEALAELERLRPRTEPAETDARTIVI